MPASICQLQCGIGYVLQSPKCRRCIAGKACVWHLQLIGLAGFNEDTVSRRNDVHNLKWGNHQQYLHCLVFVALSSVANPECSQMFKSYSLNPSGQSNLRFRSFSVAIQLSGYSTLNHTHIYQYTNISRANDYVSQRWFPLLTIMCDELVVRSESLAWKKWFGFTLKKSTSSIDFPNHWEIQHLRIISAKRSGLLWFFPMNVSH